MHLIGARQNTDVNREETRDINMKETGRAKMSEMYWGDSQVKRQREMKVNAKLFV